MNDKQVTQYKVKYIKTINGLNVLKAEYLSHKDCCKLYTR